MRGPPPPAERQDHLCELLFSQVSSAFQRPNLLANCTPWTKPDDSSSAKSAGHKGRTAYGRVPGSPEEARQRDGAAEVPGPEGLLVSWGQSCYLGRRKGFGTTWQRWPHNITRGLKAPEMYTRKWLKWQILCCTYFTTSLKTLCDISKKPRVVHFKWGDCTVCELCLNKAVFLDVNSRASVRRGRRSSTPSASPRHLPACLTPCIPVGGHSPLALPTPGANGPHPLVQGRGPGEPLGWLNAPQLRRRT